MFVFLCFTEAPRWGAGKTIHTATGTALPAAAIMEGHASCVNCSTKAQHKKRNVLRIHSTDSPIKQCFIGESVDCTLGSSLPEGSTSSTAAKHCSTHRGCTEKKKEKKKRM